MPCVWCCRTPFAIPWNAKCDALVTAKAPIYVMDFEGCGKTGVIEFGVVELHEGQIGQTHTARCRPQAPVAIADSQLHGLYQEALENEEPFSTHWDAFNGWRRQGLFAAHHASVEARLLQDTWPFPSATPDRPPEWGPWLDTRYLYASVYPGLQSYQLRSLIDTFQLQTALDTLAAKHCPPKRLGYHRALYDALACASLLRHLLHQPTFADVSLDWLLAQSAASKQARSAGMQRDLF